MKLFDLDKEPRLYPGENFSDTEEIWLLRKLSEVLFETFTSLEKTMHPLMVLVFAIFSVCVSFGCKLLTV